MERGTGAMITITISMMTVQLVRNIFLEILQANKYTLHKRVRLFNEIALISKTDENYLERKSEDITVGLKHTFFINHDILKSCA